MNQPTYDNPVSVTPTIEARFEYFGGGPVDEGINFYKVGGEDFPFATITNQSDVFTAVYEQFEDEFDEYEDAVAFILEVAGI